jgi:uncharacterized protein (DUF488 family)
MIQLFTIGFTHKSAEQFFNLLRKNAVTTLVDTRINNTSQLSGFAKGSDLKFFANEVANIGYTHRVDMAPTKDLLARYRAGQMTWAEYEVEYLNLLDRRRLGDHVHIEDLHGNCLLCSEHQPDQCHRRLLAEYLQARFTGVEVTHLVK